MSGSLMNTAMSGLKTAQTALATISSNIANAKVEGYHRQTITLATDGSSTNNVNGVKVAGIQREYDEFINTNYNKSLTKQSELKVYADYALQLDKLMSASDTDLASSVTEFFSSLQMLSTDAASEPLRNVVVNKSQALVNRFKSVEQQFNAMERQLNGNIGMIADKVSQLAQQVANLNGEITKVKGLQGNVPNEILDRRDQLARELSAVVGINVVAHGETININLTNGLSLVNGNKANKIFAQPSAADPNHITLGYDDGMTIRREIDYASVTGGQLAGALAVRDEVLQPNRQKINHLGLVLAESVNQVQQGGYDLQGNAGQALFKTGQPTIVANQQNQGSSDFSAQFTNTTQVKGIDYAMTFDGNNWQVTELATKQPVTVTVTPASSTNGTKLTFAGMEIEVATTSTPQAGDQFIIKPVEGVIDGLSVVMTNPTGIAAAGQAGTGQADNSNIKEILALQDKKLIDGRSTYSKAYTSVVSDIAAKANQAKVDVKAQSVITDSYYQKQQSIAGVNLDEEYLEMTRMQEFYMSNAKVVQVANSLFETLMRIF
ncbi:flagellar hook-associated protein FlgK [Candidatus Arsenophonus nilaparvatae]|uniref:flagellar hook-associated protein FlgK n=1 Tax=Candidatus Arsenophonus nilaparvatae TaxID=1247023 RepID=UPI000509551C|nr:flagellar hook-associated protein FlgK [Candidatus Arsenophonus nilaparvatae]